MQTTYKRDQDLWSREERNQMQGALNAMQDPEAPEHAWSVTASVYGDRGKPRAAHKERAVRAFRKIGDLIPDTTQRRMHALARRRG